MIRKKYETNFDKLTSILHVSDIHIRNFKRHKEYRSIFKKLYKEAKKLPDSSIIYIGGDVVHNKTDISPELISLTSEFLNSLANIRKTILIAGNHDANLNNKSRMDSLSPIVKNINNPNLHYLRDTGVYSIADVDFVVMSVFDEPENYPSSDCTKAKTKVALYHGPINSSITDVGYVVKNPEMSLSVFDGFDMGLLGDIHKKQFLNKKETIAYSSSLIQQNFGETFHDHGFMIWDVKNRKSTFENINNDYGYYTIKIINGQCPDISDIPKMPRVRLITENTNNADVKKILTEIRKKCNIQDYFIIRQENSSEINRGSKKGFDMIRNLRDVEYQNHLMEDYINRNYLLEDSMLNNIKSINREMNKRLVDIDIGRNISWKIKSFDFSNMFSFGENNKVDFTKMDGTIGLFAANHMGKSALLDSISFCLFDKCSRASKAEDIMNNKKKSFNCKLNFEIEGVDYFIERKATRVSTGKSSVRVDVNFWMIGEGQEIISLNGEQRRETNKNIRGYIGSYDDFILTSLSVQNDNTGFIDKTQTEKKDLLSQFMDLNVFEELYQNANEEIRDITVLLNDFRNHDFTNKLAECEVLADKKKIFFGILDKEKTSKIKERNKINEKILTQTKKLVNIDGGELDLENLQLEKKNISEIINSRMKFIANQETSFKNSEDKLKSLKLKLKSYSGNLRNKYDEYVNLEKQALSKNSDLSQIKIIVRNKLDKLKKLEEHKYDPNCDYCIDNIFVKDAIKTKEELSNDKIKVSNILNGLDNLKSSISKLDGAKEKYNEKLDLETLIRSEESTFNNLTASLYETKTKLALNDKKIEEVLKHIDKFHTNKRDIERNLKISKTIKDLENQRVLINTRINELDSSLIDLHGEIKVADTTITSINTSIEEASDLEEKSKAYEYYLNSIKRNGIPYELISNALPYLEDEVNSILSQMVDFNIKFETDGKNINTIIDYGNNGSWSLSLTSGMEKFIASLAIRVSLISLTNLPCPNFIAIDEGFGNLDPENINSMGLFFNYLKNYFSFMLIISHIDTMKDTTESLVEINKVGDYSLVNY